MPRGAMEGLLSANRDTVLVAAVHAAAHLVLAVVGEERIDREQRLRYVTVLKQLIKLSREELDRAEVP